MILSPVPDTGRGERHRRRRVVDGGRHHALRRDDDGQIPLECVQFMKKVAGRIEDSAIKGYNTALPLKYPQGPPP